MPDRGSPLVYLDHNAGAPLLAAARAAMIAALDRFGGVGANPSSPHRPGHEARLCLEESREAVARLLGAPPDSLVFVSGGTEADNLAIQGAARAWIASRGTPGRILATAVEHPAVLEPCRHLASRGFALTPIPVDRHGRAEAGEAVRSLGPGVAVVSVMLANNETGVIQPAEEIARAARTMGIPVHVDAVQAAGRIPVHVSRLDADFVSISSHKMGGPAGIGALYVRDGAPLRPVLLGGSQEGRRRPGTEAVALAAGFAAAAREAGALAGVPDMTEGRTAGSATPDAAARGAAAPASMAALAALRDRFEARVTREIPGARVNGAGAPRLPNTTSLIIPGVDAEAIVIAMDLRGFAISTGSACSTGASRPSHVLEAMGLPPAEARSTVRVSLGPGNTAAQIERLADALRDEAARRPDRSGGSDAGLSVGMAVAEKKR